ncbi:MAG TPA: hypothetical protein VLT35_07360, partial [Methanocella sp.]|nr:hypothetical protein [Methanocella sp.]
TRIFLRMADLIVRGGTPYVDFADPKPPLVFFLLAAPQALGHGMAGGALLAALANFVSAVAVLKIGWRLYGRGAGLLGGTLFIVNVAWAEGYFVLTEPFALAFILLSAYFLTGGGRHRYLLAGISAGLAIGFKQYSLLLVPLSLFYAYRKGEAKQALAPYLAGVLLPLLVAFAALFVAYGTDAGLASLYWSFGTAQSYFSEGSIGGISTYKISDPAIASVWIALALSLFAPLLLLAVAGTIAHKMRPEEELFALAAIAFIATLIVRPFLHYWALALPFAALFAAGAFGHWEQRRRRPWPAGDITFAVLACAIEAIVLIASACVTYVLMTGRWMPRGIQELYGLADIILKATAPYFGHVPEPAAVSVGMRLSYSLLAVAGASLASAVVVTAIAWRLYGRGPALLAGTLFAAATAFALGYMQPSDGVAVLLLALSLLLLALDKRGGPLAAGLLMGAAIAIKPFAVILALLALLMLLRIGKRWQAIGFVVCVLLPVAVFGAAAGGGALNLSGQTWGVSLGPPVPGTSAVYHVPDLLMATLNLAAAGSFATVMVVVSAAAFLWRRAGPAEEFLLLATLALSCTLFFGTFVHYWFVALPFAVVLCVRPFSVDKKVIMSGRP